MHIPLTHPPLLMIILIESHFRVSFVLQTLSITHVKGVSELTVLKFIVHCVVLWLQLLLLYHKWSLCYAAQVVYVRVVFDWWEVDAFYGHYLVVWVCFVGVLNVCWWFLRVFACFEWIRVCGLDLYILKFLDGFSFPPLWYNFCSFDNFRYFININSFTSVILILLLVGTGNRITDSKNRLMIFQLRLTRPFNSLFYEHIQHLSNL